jgi:hypothetical protein
MRRAIGWGAFCVGYLLAYLISTTIPTPLLWHLPAERRFTFEVRPLQLGADFYGRLLLSLLCGGLAFIAARLLLRKVEPRPEWLRALAIWTLSLLCFTGGLYVYTLWARSPIPAPLPPAYAPR